MSHGPPAGRTPPAGVVSRRSRLGNTSSRTAPSGRASRGLFRRPSSKSPASSPAPPGAGTAPASRSCSPTGGAVRRCSSFLRQQTSVGRHAHRWPMGLRMRPVRPRSGKRGDRRSGLGREGRRRRGWGGIGGDGFFLSFLNFLYFLCYYFTSAFGG